MASLIWACGGTLEDRGHEAASAAFDARALRQPFESSIPWT
jgi:hypothetical protein